MKNIGQIKELAYIQMEIKLGESSCQDAYWQKWLGICLPKVGVYVAWHIDC